MNDVRFACSWGLGPGEMHDGGGESGGEDWKARVKWTLEELERACKADHRDEHLRSPT